MLVKRQDHIHEIIETGNIDLDELILGDLNEDSL